MRQKKALKFEKSLKYFQDALEYLPAGVSSNARLWRTSCPTYAPCSIFVDKAKGPYIWDVDGNKYIDYRLGFGPVILGHSFPAVHAATHRMTKKGVIFGLDHQLEIEVAKKVQQAVPCAEMVRYSTSGTEATMHAIRFARAYTGKEKILKFEGHYHGAHDYVLFSTDPPIEKAQPHVPYPMSGGIPRMIKDLVLVEPWNDFEAVERAVRKNRNEIAAIITEPVMGNSAVIPPKPGYLKHLKELCDRHDIILIFDEVKTGFRLAMGGAQEMFRVTPHMATFAKSVGNGYPISMITGFKEIMEGVKPGSVAHGGTYAGNPISLAASNATLEFMKRKHVFEHIDHYGKKLMGGLRKTFAEHKQDVLVQGFPGMFQFLFTKKEAVRDYREFMAVDFNKFAAVHMELLNNGILIDEDNGEPMFTSLSHGNKELQLTLEAFDRSVDSAMQLKTPVGHLRRFR